MCSFFTCHVARDFDGVLLQVTDQAAPAREDVAEALAETRKRQRVWLQRGPAETKKCAWRPRNLHRGAAKKFLVGLDHQLVLAGLREGLRTFHIPQAEEERGPWRTWPHLSIAMDCGPDGVAAVHYLQRYQNYNIDVVPDVTDVPFVDVLV